MANRMCMRLEKDTKVQRLMHLIRERPAIYAQFCVRQVIYLTERYLGKNLFSSLISQRSLFR